VSTSSAGMKQPSGLYFEQIVHAVITVRTLHSFVKKGKNNECAENKKHVL